MDTEHFFQPHFQRWKNQHRGDRNIHKIHLSKARVDPPEPDSPTTTSSRLCCHRIPNPITFAMTTIMIIGVGISSVDGVYTTELNLIFSEFKFGKNVGDLRFSRIK